MPISTKMYYKPYKLDEFNGRNGVIIKIIWDLYVVQTNPRWVLQNFTSKLRGMVDVPDYTSDRQWVEEADIDDRWLRRRVLNGENCTWGQLRSRAIENHQALKKTPDSLEEPAVLPSAESSSWTETTPVLTNVQDYHDLVRSEIVRRRLARIAARQAEDGGAE